MNFDKYIINSAKCILDALVQLNKFNNDEPMTLFVEESSRIVGSLTDGDVRRALVNGVSLDQPVLIISHKSFSYLKEEEFEVRLIHTAKSKGIELLPILNDDMRLVGVVNLKKQQSYLPIDAVLMAGGKGERLRPLTEKTPKPLLKVGDKCIIDHNVDRLIKYGVKHINVTVNYLAEHIEEHYDEPRDGIKVQTTREPKFLGTIGSIKFVKSFYNDVVLVMNSDLFTNIDYEDFYLHFEEHEADMSVVAVPYTVSIPYGILDLDGRNIKGLLEKPKYNYYANAGIYLIKKSAFKEIPEDTFFNATDLIEKLISENKKVIRYPLIGTWIDIGTPQEYQKAQELVKHLKMF